MKFLIFKRIGAYAIDYLFIFLLLTMLSQIRFLNPTYDLYMDNYDKYLDIMDNVSSENVLDIINDSEYQEVNYNLSKYSVSVSITSIILYLAYFVGFQKWNKNQTLGKKLFNISVKNKKDDGNPSWGQMFLRTIILYNILFEIFLIISLYIFNASEYIVVSNIITILAAIVFYANVFFIIFRKDNAGIHDLIAKTKVN